MFDDVEFIEIIEDVRGNTENRLSGKVNSLENRRSQNRTVQAREWEVPKVDGLGSGQSRNRSVLKMDVLGNGGQGNERL